MTSRMHHRRGYTLLELVVSLPLMTLLMLGLAGAIHLAGSSFPSGATGPSATLKTAAALQQFAADVQYATAITGSTATTLTIRVTDRDGDNAEETIGYSWSGIAGAPLQRQVNGSPFEDVVANVQQFGIGYNTRAGGAGTQLVRSMNVRILASSAASAGFDAQIRLFNEPLLPP